MTLFPVLATTSFAFFDVDETIIRDKSMFSILKAIERTNTTFRQKNVLKRLVDLRDCGADRTTINKAFYESFAGLLQKQVQKLAEEYFLTQLKNSIDFFIKPAVDCLRWHAAHGIEPVFVSGSSIDFLQPLARYLDVHHLLATRLFCDLNGKYTGVIDGEVMIGSGKRHAVNQFIARQRANASFCYAYGDHPSDIEFLNCVGFPSVVAGNSALEQIARERGWPIL